MIWRFSCDICNKQMKNSKERIKCTVIPYKHIGDICLECWNKVTKEKQT